jgi:uncharacterized membrane protein YjjB (DUF3815 family)
VAILFVLRAGRRQWLKMSITSFASFVAFTFARAYFSQDIASAIAAFVLGIVANSWARWTNEIAIASVLAGMSFVTIVYAIVHKLIVSILGIFWIVPGVVGAKSAFAFVSDTDQGDSGTVFGLDMIIRAMSIAIGLHLANVAMFPMQQKKARQLDEAMAV